LNTKTSVEFNIITIAAAVLLFAAGPLVATYQAWACGFGGWGGGWRPHFYGGFGNGPYSGGYGGNGPYSGGYGGNGPYSGGYGGNGY